MPLPFLEPKKMTSIIMAKRAKGPDVEMNSEVEAPGSEMDPGLKEAMIDLMRAMETKSPMDMAKAFKAAFQVCESYPHEEAEHEDME